MYAGQIRLPKFLVPKHATTPPASAPSLYVVRTGIDRPAASKTWGTATPSRASITNVCPDGKFACLRLRMIVSLPPLSLCSDGCNWTRPPEARHGAHNPDPYIVPSVSFIHRTFASLAPRILAARVS